MTSEEKVNRYVELKTELMKLEKIMTIEELGEANSLVINEEVKQKKYVLY